MFQHVWRWAGQFRRRNTNLGIDWPQISEQSATLCGDARFWIESHTYRPVELGARFHHRLVSIHEFPNGNGRHARLATDLLFELHGYPQFTWGSTALGPPSDVRSRYIAALVAADKGDFGPLIEFCEG